MVQRTVLKVQLSCQKCRKKLLKSISSILGVDKIEIDATKDTVTVIGDADPYAIILQARKAIKQCVEVVTIGPPPPPPKKPDEKKPEEKKTTEKKTDSVHPYIVCHMPHHRVACPEVAVVHMTQDPCTTCSIM